VNAYIIAAVAGYILGSLPFGYLVARARGVNIFEVGSGSSGATNVRRVLGPGAGYAVFALDALKGAVAAGVPFFLFHSKPVAVAGLLFAMLGHSFSCFTRFRGGKGVATGAGGFLVLMPPVTLIAVAVWTITFYFSRYVSLASILAAAAMPVAACLVDESGFIIAVTVLVGVFIVARHRANIGRLLKGTEDKCGKK
jgi:glycerol-3-phosphate acyltransferase PlsY